MSRKILVVEDNKDLARLLELHLRDLTYEVDLAFDGNAGWAQIASNPYDLIILDLMLPGIDGLEICRRIRAQPSYTPILMLTSKSTELDRVLGLEIGADDYVTKPFSPRELVARVNAILKRLRPPPAQERPAALSHGRLCLDAMRHMVSWADKPVALTATELSILKAFVGQPDRVFDRDTIVRSAYNVNVHVSDRTIDSHIRHIRSKFTEIGCASVIETVHGVGYRLGSAV